LGAQADHATGHRQSTTGERGGPEGGGNDPRSRALPVRPDGFPVSGATPPRVLVVRGFRLHPAPFDGRNLPDFNIEDVAVLAPQVGAQHVERVARFRADRFDAVDVVRGE